MSSIGAFEPECQVAATVLRSSTGAKTKNLILGFYDHIETRAFVSEEMFALRTHARTQAVLYSLMSAFVLQVAFMPFVAPGFLWLWVLWRSSSSVGEFPTPGEILGGRSLPAFRFVTANASVSPYRCRAVQPTGPQEAARSDLR